MNKLFLLQVMWRWRCWTWRLRRRSSCRPSKTKWASSGEFTCKYYEVVKHAILQGRTSTHVFSGQVQRNVFALYNYSFQYGWNWYWYQVLVSIPASVPITGTDTQYQHRNPYGCRFRLPISDTGIGYNIGTNNRCLYWVSVIGTGTDTRPYQVLSIGTS